MEMEYQNVSAINEAQRNYFQISRWFLLAIRARIELRLQTRWEKASGLNAIRKQRQKSSCVTCAWTINANRKDCWDNNMPRMAVINRSKNQRDGGVGRCFEDSPFSAHKFINSERIQNFLFHLQLGLLKKKKRTKNYPRKLWRLIPLALECLRNFNLVHQVRFV